jgi:hypothetical protein
LHSAPDVINRVFENGMIIWCGVASMEGGAKYITQKLYRRGEFIWHK